MGISTIAERVDSADVLHQLAEIGVQYAQGHYIASPQPVEVMTAMLAQPEESAVEAGETGETGRMAG
jgi:EAL domain-containing protein (putative c-di-GMP-specific phosphodiesterase class I)